MSVTGNVLEFEPLNSNEFTITGLSVPTQDDIVDIANSPYSSIITIGNDWWLRDGKYVGPRSFKKLHFNPTEFKNHKGIRPLIEFHCSELEVGDEFMYNNVLFFIYSKGKAISKAAVKFCTYNNRDNKTPTYSTSELNYCLTQWHSVALGKKAYKVTDKVQFPVNIRDITLFPFSYLNAFSPGLFANNITFWLKERKDEFTGYCVNSAGFSEITNINEIHNVCLSICSHKVAPDVLNDMDYFEIKGLLWSTLRTRSIFENDLEFTALCLNPIGATCYSSGIAEIGECSEDSFFLTSEAANLIGRWKNSIK